MTQLGKVYGNRMVDLQPRSKKLTARALGLIKFLGRVNEKIAMKFLRESGGNAKRAILMARKKINRLEAARRLKKVDGHLHAALSLK